MTMRAMTTMTLLGALNQGTSANLPAFANMKYASRFADTLLQAAMPSATSPTIAPQPVVPSFGSQAEGHPAALDEAVSKAQVPLLPSAGARESLDTLTATPVAGRAKEDTSSLDPTATRQTATASMAAVAETPARHTVSTTTGTKAVKSVKAAKAHSVAMRTGPRDATAIPATAMHGAAPGPIVTASASTNHAAPHPMSDAVVPVGAPVEEAGKTTAEQPAVPASTVSASSVPLPVEVPSASIVSTAAAVVVEQTRAVAEHGKQQGMPVAKSARKTSVDEMHAASQKPPHLEPQVASTMIASGATTPPLASQAPLIAPLSVQSAELAIQAAPMTVAAVPPAPQEGTTSASQHENAHSVIAPTPNPEATQPMLVHTTLNASPTVLEVGVSGGSHGWLKIRAEIVDGGAVQASLVSLTHAGHETLHRDLPEMTAFLASEQLAVQLHVAEAPQNIAAQDHDLTQAFTPGDRGGGGSEESPRREAATPRVAFADGPDSTWDTTDGGVLHGGSWVNVVA